MREIPLCGRLILAITAMAALVVSAHECPLHAQEGVGAQDRSAETDERTDDPLDARQDNVARRYVRFEKTLLQMAEYMRKTEPERAELLVRAIARSKENRIAHEMQQVVDLLKNEQYGEALERETQLVEHLKSLLELLQSEDRKSEIEEEKRRILELLGDVGKLIGKQKDVRAATERGGAPARLTDRQQKVTDDTKRLVDKIDRQDAERNADAKSGSRPDKDSQQGDSADEKPGDSDSKPDDADNGQPGEGKPDQGQQGEGKPTEGKPGEGQPGESQPREGKPGEGQPGGEPSGSQSPENSPAPAEQNRTPGRDDIEQARREMERALERLEKQDRRGASNRQDEAVMQLQRAKEKLEEILRQLREEEMELLLAALEARFQKMLAEQWLVYNSTVSLDKTPKPEWTSRHFGRARELAQTESEIALEAAKALMLLKEEGSSVAFPEAVEQLHHDMLTVTRRLERTEVGQLTQTIERDIIESLEELIEALQREMEKQKEQQRRSMSRPGQPDDRPLVDTLAELKMLRTLQLRVNRRTRRLGGLVEGDQATDPDVLEQLRELSSRQARIQEATNDLATGRNR